MLLMRISQILVVEDTGVTASYEMDSRDLSSFSTPCPLEPDSDCDPELPDPPEAPEPPEPECGDKEVRAVQVYSLDITGFVAGVGARRGV